MVVWFFRARGRGANSFRPFFLHLASATVHLRGTRSDTGDDEKRDRERVEILGELHGEVMVFQPLSIKEISRGGCLVETAFPLHLNSLHDIRLTLGEQSVVLKGRVAHCRISDVDQEIVHYRSGIEFIEPSDRIHEVIVEFIEAIKAGRKLV